MSLMPGWCWLFRSSYLPLYTLAQQCQSSTLPEILTSNKPCSIQCRELLPAPLVPLSVKLFRPARKKQQVLNILLHHYPQQSRTGMFCTGPQEYFLNLLEEGSPLAEVQHPRNTAVLFTLHYTELITYLRKLSIS